MTDTQDNRCHVSKTSYPYLIKLNLGYSKSESISCSGAMIKDVYDINKRNYAKDSPQASTLQDPAFDAQIYENFLPGHRRQVEFVSRKQPRVMTLSVGGNDINFGEKVQKCVLRPDTCYSSDSEKAAVVKELKSIFNNLVTTYSNILKSSADSKLYIIGYPLIAKPDGNCALNVRLNNEEIKFSEAIIKDLNTVIETASDKAGAKYVDVSGAFFGHRMCETDSWNVAVNGLTAGKDTPFEWGPIGGASYHPNKLGHRLYKDKILEQTTQFTAETPEPNEEASLDDMQSELVSDASDSENTPLPVSSRIAQNSVLKKSTSLDGGIANTPAYISTGTVFQAELHSEPIAIGTATAIDLHNLQLQVQIPENTEPGMHTMHLFGTNLAGEEIDLYQDLYVISSATDYDGDGITNEEDRCQFIEGSGIDSDTDGADDACDAFIDATPAQDSPVPSEEGADDSTETTENNVKQESRVNRSRAINTSNRIRSQTAELISNRGNYLSQNFNSDGPLSSQKALSGRGSSRELPKSNTKNRLNTKQNRPTWKQFLFFFGVSAPIAAVVIYRARSID